MIESSNDEMGRKKDTGEGVEGDMGRVQSVTCYLIPTWSYNKTLPMATMGIVLSWREKGC